MKHGKIIIALKVLYKMGEQALPLPISYQIFKLIKHLRPAWDFQLEQEGKIMNMYPPEQIENGRLKFASKEDKQSFQNAMKELYDMDSDIEVTPINIPILEEMKLSPVDIEALQDFVFFTEPEGIITK